MLMEKFEHLIVYNNKDITDISQILYQQKVRLLIFPVIVI